MSIGRSWGWACSRNRKFIVAKIVGTRVVEMRSDGRIGKGQIITLIGLVMSLNFILGLLGSQWRMLVTCSDLYFKKFTLANV